MRSATYFFKFPRVLVQIIPVISLIGSCLGITVSDPPNVYRSYQKTIYCNASMPIQEPKSATEIVQIVQYARAKGLTVKAFGSRHSITDIICTEGIPISMTNIKHKVLNQDGTATFGAGIQLQEAIQFLQIHNRSLIHVPTFGGITIGGAIGTGAHGSSLIHPPSLSDQVVRLTVITGQGSVRTVSSMIEVNMFRVHLGLLGIVVDVTLETVPLFKMTVRNSRHSEKILFTHTLPKMARKFDMIQAWWFPSTSSVVVATGNYTSVKTPGNAHSNFIPNIVPTFIAGSTIAFDLLQASMNTKALKSFEAFTEKAMYTKVLGKPPVYSENLFDLENPATGYASLLQSNTCSQGILKRCSWFNLRASILPEESSMAFDISQFKGVMQTIRDVIQEYPVAFPLVGIYIRFSKASSALMAISHGRPTFTVEWATPMRINPFENPKLGIEAYQLLLQKMVTNHGGRPHWAKNGLYYTTRSVLDTAFSNIDDFVAGMNKYDKTGIFANKFSNRIRGISDTMDVDPRVQHCALQDYCICNTKHDCADFQTCEKVNLFSICSSVSKPLLRLPIY